MDRSQDREQRLISKVRFWRLPTCGALLFALVAPSLRSANHTVAQAAGASRDPSRLIGRVGKILPPLPGGQEAPVELSVSETVKLNIGSDRNEYSSAQVQLFGRNVNITAKSDPAQPVGG